MAGILYGVGVGPGDPELMTLKAVRLVRENEVIALPGPEAKETVAHKTLLSLVMPMTHDKEEMARNHEKAADTIAEYLKEGKNVVFLTLGDPTIYSTYLYVQKGVKARGYEAALVSGITSFCAAAARTNTPLVEWSEQLHVLPAVHRLEDSLSQPGTYVLMKSGRKMQQVKEILSASGRDVVMVENCGMENEHIYRSTEEIPDDAGYYSLIIAKEPTAQA